VLTATVRRVPEEKAPFAALQSEADLLFESGAGTATLPMLRAMLAAADSGLR
jgi:hypothetical protein